MAARKLFVNIQVADLGKAKAFYGALGFTFNAKFTDEKAACMVVNDDAYFMLLTPAFFAGFTTRQPCELATHTEALFAVSCASRAEVDEIVHKAVAAGGAPAMPPQDHGFMYGWSFYDVDGHHWEVLWMDPSRV